MDTTLACRDVLNRHTPSPLMAILEDPLGVEVHLSKGIMGVWWAFSIGNGKEIAGNTVLKPLSGTVGCTTQKRTAYIGEMG